MGVAYFNDIYFILNTELSANVGWLFIGLFWANSVISTSMQSQPQHSHVWCKLWHNIHIFMWFGAWSDLRWLCTYELGLKQLIPFQMPSWLFYMKTALSVMCHRSVSCVCSICSHASLFIYFHKYNFMVWSLANGVARHMDVHDQGNDF
jgi:hypothetical protein